MLSNLFLGQFILFYILPIVDSLECKPTFIEQNELIFQTTSKHYMIQSDSDDYANINQNQFPFAQQLNTIPYDQQAQIIYTIIIDSWYKEFILEKQLCSLSQLEGHYYITCIFIEGLFQNVGVEVEDEVGEIQRESQEHQQLYTSFERFKMPIFTLITENCQFLFQNDLEELSLLCISSNSLNIYFINLNSFQLTKQYNEIDETQFKQCKIKYEQFIEYSFLIIFYDCISWAIYIYKNTELSLLFNREIAIKNDPSFIFNLVEKLQICQDNLVLIEDNTYYHYSYRPENRLSFNYFQRISFLKQILFDEDCVFKYFLVGSELNHKFYIKDQIFNYELESIPKYVYYVSNILFLINQNELEVIVNKQMKQKLQLKTFPLQFIQMTNIFYQIDLESKAYTFFKCHRLNIPILKPQKNYLLIDAPSQCKQLIRQKTSNNTSNISLKLNQQCDNIEKAQIEKKYIFLPDYFQVVLKKDPLNLIDTIYDKQPFEQICHTPKMYLKDSRLLFHNSKGKGYSIFQNSKYLYILNCDNQQLFQIYIQNQKVINYYDRVIIVDYQVEHFKFLKISYDTPILKKYNLESSIQEVQHCSKYVLFITQSKRLVLFDLNQEQYIQLPKLLNRLFISIYLTNINENEQSKKFFLDIHKNSYFIQYQEFLIVFQKNSLSHFKLKQQQIIQIKQIHHVLESYRIITVDLNENALKQYFFDQIDLNLWGKYTFTNSQIIYPISYQEVQEFIAIQVMVKNLSYTHIFSSSQTQLIKQQQIIQTSQNYTFISFNNLYYFDANNELQVLDLHYLNIQFKSLEKQKNKINLNENFMFYIDSQSNLSQRVEYTVNLSIIVNCPQLLSLNNQFLIILDENHHQILHLNDLFEGPIDILKIQDNSSVILEGPFLSTNLQNEFQIETYMIEYFKINVSLTTIMSQFNNEKKILKIQIIDEQSFLFFNYINILQGFYINEYQILFIYSVKYIMKAQIFTIDQDNLKLIKYSNEFTFEDALDYPEIIQMGNLFQIYLQFDYSYFYIQDNNIFKLTNKNGFSNLILIQNSDQLYLQLQFGKNKHSLTINTIKIINKELESINQFTVYFDEILLNLSTYIYNYYKFEYSQKQTIPITASTDNQTLTIKCLIILDDFSAFQFIYIDQNTGDTNQTALKILRLPQIYNCKLHFIGDNYLILNQEDKYLIYDFQVTKQIYDYIYSYQGNLNQIYPYNTTHYIFHEQENDNFKLGWIDYRISILNDEINNDTCTLIAENKIFKVQITLLVYKNQIQNQFILQSITQYGIVFLMLIIIILILYFIRRSFLKLKFKQPNKEQLFNNQ